jgi:glycine/D-amino acid oxidase-like deaminating enzyme
MPRRVSLLTEWQHEASHKWGHDGLQFIPREDLPQWVASERYQAGLYDAEGAHLNPLKLALGLAAAIERAGGRIHEQSKALSYRQEGRFSGQYRTRFGEGRCAGAGLQCLSR